MPKANLTRRNLVLALLAGATLGRSTQYWQAFASDRQPLDIELPLNPDFSKPSFELFLALSQLVTARDQLDQQMAEKMYPLFMAEPWGAHHISSTYQQILAFTDNPIDGQSASVLPDRSRLDEGQAWFADHLLATWYLGVYYHESSPTQRVGHEYCLMFDAIRNKLPIPYVEATGFGGWATVPNN